jgi:hypothetical protein
MHIYSMGGKHSNEGARVLATVAIAWLRGLGAAKLLGWRVLSVSPEYAQELLLS